jgi:uncharacterized protein YndB with AHSA1/START domain
MTSLSGSAVLSTPTDTEIVMVREFDAPPELVWKAWTTPELVSRWWPGKRGTMKTCEIDLRVGGQWRYVMEAGEGGYEVAFHGEYREIVEAEKLVNTEVFEGAPPEAGAALNTNVFEAIEGGRTRLTMTTAVGSKEVRDMIIGTGMETGAQEGLDIIDEIVAELTAAGPASAAR